MLHYERKERVNPTRYIFPTFEHFREDAISQVGQWYTLCKHFCDYLICLRIHCYVPVVLNHLSVKYTSVNISIIFISSEKSVPWILMPFFRIKHCLLSNYLYWCKLKVESKTCLKVFVETITLLSGIYAQIVTTDKRRSNWVLL